MKSAVLTGGNKGLGLAQTRRFLAAGHRVHVVSRSRGELDSLGANDRLEWVRHDLEDWRDVDFLDRIAADTGGIDVLVNNAGVHLKKPVWEVEPNELEAVLDLNVKAMFRACGRLVTLHRQRPEGTSAAIVNLSSMTGLLALPSAAAYVTAKTAVIGLTRSVALDAAPYGIRCNAVCPGFIDTDMTRAILAKDPARRERIVSRIPDHRFGTPDDIADAVHWLGGDASRYVNGVALPVDGGFSIGF